MRVNTYNTRGIIALRRHYEIERELADRLRVAKPSERCKLYSVVYDELFQRVPDHPQNLRKQSPEDQERAAKSQLRTLDRLLTRDAVYLEIGPGDCYLAKKVAERVRYVYAADVSTVIASSPTNPENFTFVATNGIDISVPNDSVDIAYSNQLMEHLHPDDAKAQLQSICRALKQGGVYLCITPHRYSGPHDISRYFDTQATGFHLREYTYGELRSVFCAAGLPKAVVWLGLKGHYIRFPIMAAMCCEWILKMVPTYWRRWLCKSPLLRPLFYNASILGIKG